jgi:hypothetical protein
MNTRFIAKAVCILGLTGLASCGGSGDSAVAPPAPDLGTAEGLWTGSDSNNRSVAGVVLDTGQYWFIYTAMGNNAVLAGAVEGNSTSSNGTFTSSNGIDFNLEGLGINDFSASGPYTKQASLNATLTESAGTTTIALTYGTDYDLTPSLMDVAGNYTGQGIAVGTTVETVDVSISNSGALTGSSSGGCLFTGMVTIHPKGNVYDVSVQFGGAPCAGGTGTVTGIGYYSATNKSLISAALNSDRTQGFLFLGSKP